MVVQGVTRTELAQWLLRGDKDRAGPVIVQGVIRTELVQWLFRG